jgi:hypothetical protein
MSHNTPFNTLVGHFSERHDEHETAMVQAVDVLDTIKQAGLVIVPTDVIAVLAIVISSDGASIYQLQDLLKTFGLAEIVAYDPAVHTGDVLPDTMPGDSYLKYSDALSAVIRLAKPHVTGRVH